jgi:NAD(P)-dependent dehydrogenase (short-subunit alcohol dehydrogenase family)
MDINGRSFIVTGGASGLGAACVEMLAQAGGRPVALDMNRAAGEALITRLGETATFVEADVADEPSVRRALDAATALAPLGGAVSCAGIAPAARIVGRDGPHDLALFERVVRVNLVGTFNVLRLTAAALADVPAGPDGERGAIVCTASVAAFEGQIGQAAYAASKGGVASLTLPAARELARIGVRVVTVAPGIFETPMTLAMTDEVRKSLAAQIPFPSRLGKPAEFASLVRQILENPMLNGEVIRLDGAVRMGSK